MTIDARTLTRRSALALGAARWNEVMAGRRTGQYGALIGAQ